MVKNKAINQPIIVKIFASLIPIDSILLINKLSTKMVRHPIKWIMLHPLINSFVSLSDENKKFLGYYYFFIRKLYINFLDIGLILILLFFYAAILQF